MNYALLTILALALSLSGCAGINALLVPPPPPSPPPLRQETRSVEQFPDGHSVVCTTVAGQEPVCEVHPAH